MIEILSYTWMQRALAGGILIGALCAVIGVYVVLRSLAFIGAGIAHASFGGVAIGFALGANPIWTAVVFCVLTSWGIAGVSRHGNVKEDTVIGIFFASTMALGALIIGVINAQVDVFGYLFGSITAVTSQDLWTIVLISAVVLGCIGWFFKDLMFVTFDQESAEVAGLPATKLYFLLITLIALTVVMSIKVVGIVLVSALIVTPAAAAYQLTESFRKMMALSALFGMGSCVLGLLLSAWLNVPSGAAIVLISTAAFFICLALSPRRRRRGVGC